MHRVSGNRKSRAGDVVVGEIAEGLLKFATPISMAARDLLRARTGLPDAEQPDPVEAHLREAIQLGVGNVIERQALARPPRQLGEPDAGVDLVERWIAGRGHRSASIW